MPDFVKKKVKTEVILRLEMGTANRSLAELQDLMTKRIASLVKKYGPEARTELLFRNGLYNLYIIKPEHLEEDWEYNERILREVKAGK